MQNYSTIIGVIELRQDGIGYRTIRRRYDIGNSVITLIMERFRELGTTLDEIRIMNPRDVEAKFYPEENRRDTSKSRPDFFTIHEMMTKMKHPDLAFIWLDYYKPKHPDVLSSRQIDFFLPPKRPIASVKSGNLLLSVRTIHRDLNDREQHKSGNTGSACEE